MSKSTYVDYGHPNGWTDVMAMTGAMIVIHTYNFMFADTGTPGE